LPSPSTLTSSSFSPSYLNINLLLINILLLLCYFVRIIKNPARLNLGSDRGSVHKYCTILI
jgi:hypothetical protein